MPGNFEEELEFFYQAICRVQRENPVDILLVNQDQCIRLEKLQQVSAAVLQCPVPSITDIVLNELYVRNRFMQLTVVREEKYREIFLHNPRVSGFLSYQEFQFSRFERVYCCVCNETAGLIQHILVYEKGNAYEQR